MDQSFKIFSLKGLLLFLTIFIILYCQPLVVGGIKISFVTIGIIYIYIINKLIKYAIRKNSIYWSSLSVAIKSIFSTGFVNTLSFLVLDSIKSLTFPLSFLYFTNFINFYKLRNAILSFSCYIVLTSIPFLVGILSPINSGYSLEIFGSESSGFIGVFENSHSASICMSLCTLNLIYFLYYNNFNENIVKINKFTILFCVFLGLYVIYKTYVRTGYIMLGVGFLVMFLYNFKAKNLFKYVSIFVITTLVLFVIVNNDETLKNRLLDSQEYSSSDQTENLGSGRLIFQISAFTIWLRGNLLDMIFGIGIENFTNEMKAIVGLKIYAHNGFTTALVKDGIIGLILYIIFIYILFKKSFDKNSKDKPLLVAYAFAYFVYQMVQGGVISPVMELLISSVFSLSSFAWLPTFNHKPNTEYEFV